MRKLWLGLGCASVLVFFLTPAFAQDAAPPAQDQAAPAATDQPGARKGVEEIIVTAQKREENINDVGMSIQAATGDELAALGVTDTSQLDKVVTGFNYNVTYYGTPIYTIRAVGFQDTALASSPTVSIYLDEMPLPFAIMSQGSTLDLQRVEALKGPQGTLFGQNATGGAVNYIANKPSQEFETGFDFSYGRFNTVDITGFVGGPITETLSYRAAGRVLRSGDWQKNYAIDKNLAPDPYWTTAGQTYHVDAESGEAKFYNMRGALLWEPTDALSALFTVSGFLDKSESQMPQLFGIATLNQVSGANPLVANFPAAPHNDRAAAWGPCVNSDGGDPNTDVTDPNPIPDNGAGDINTANRLYDQCTPQEKDNSFYSTTLRVDYEFDNDMTLTSLTSWGKFTRDAAYESDGTLYQDYESLQHGYLKAFFQEFRLSGAIRGEGNWVVGANYENTSTWDHFLQTYGISTAVPTFVPRIFDNCATTPPPNGVVPFFLVAGNPNCVGLDPSTGFTTLANTSHPLGPTEPNSRQTTDTYAFFASGEYPVLDNVTLLGGIRYTNQHRDYRGCGSDGGDGTWATISADIQRLLQYFNNNTVLTNGLDVGPGNCGSTGPPPTFAAEGSGFTGKLDEDNVSWRAGVNWTPTAEMLLYFNVSKGFKAGSFPTVASAAFTQLFPATQEELLAYELGGKVGLFDGTMQLNGAFFYYDYTDKQVLGAINDPVFGSLPALVNVPESHVLGFELSTDWQPFDGMKITPSVSYAKSEIDGTFRNFDAYFNTGANASTKDFSGEPFPNAPEWQFNVDTQYEWNMGEWLAFIGGNLNYQSETKGFFFDRCNEGPTVTCTKDFLDNNPQNYGNSELIVPARALLDLRAGAERGPIRAWLWGRNVTDEHYWNQAQHVNDVLLRYTGMPATYGFTVSYRYGG